MKARFKPPHKTIEGYGTIGLVRSQKLLRFIYFQPKPSIQGWNGERLDHE
jgi:hypothetical protein